MGIGIGMDLVVLELEEAEIESPRERDKRLIGEEQVSIHLRVVLLFSPIFAMSRSHFFLPG